MTMRLHIIQVVTGLALLGAAGCSLEPDYARPDAPIVPNWPAQTAGQGQIRTADVGWRDFFHDAVLQRLIQLALDNNRDLRIAALNVGEAQARYRVQHADLFPMIGGSAIEQAERFPAGVVGASSAGAGPTSGGGTSATGASSAGSAATGTGGSVFRFYDVGVGFTSYEIDLFGRIRSLGHAALEQYFSADETRRAATLSLVAEVAGGYFTLLADQAMLNVSRDTLQAQQASYELTRKNLESGNGTELALRQAQITVETARADIAAEQRQMMVDRDALVLLLGAPLPADAGGDGKLDDEELIAQLPTDIPSAVLVDRPDILSTEHQLLAANANIGAARAAFFPSISLTANYGTAASQLTGLFKSASDAWTFSPQITVPIFTAGANEANLDLAKLEKNVAIAQYEKAIQTGFREVSDALSGLQTYDDQLAAQAALVDASSRAFSLADLRFRNGVDSYLTVLDAQRSLYSAQEGLISVRLGRLQNLVTLYKALGGGVRERTESVH
jgi:multidrug efflux system outer membrane protein